MASSQIHISSSAPFDCVLRDKNLRDRCRESNARATQAAFQKNLQNLVNSISVSSDSPPSETFEKNQDLHCRASSECGETVNLTKNLPKLSSRSFDSTSEGFQTPSEQTLSPGASSLVQIWEKRVNKSNSMKLNGNVNVNNNPIASPRKAVSDIGNSENGFPPETGDSVTETYDEGPRNDSLCERSAPSSPSSLQGQSSRPEAGENDRVRVADIIKRLTGANLTQSPTWSSIEDDDQVANDLPLRNQAEQRCFPLVTSSPKIRGRQAFADLLMYLERERQRELDTLVERHAVSKFSQRGRIQSLLRLRFLKSGAGVEHQRRSLPRSMSVQLSRLQQVSNIMHLRERFSAGCENASTPHSNASSPTPSIPSENCSESSTLKECAHQHEIDVKEGQNNIHVEESSMSHALPEKLGELNPSLHMTRKESGSVVSQGTLLKQIDDGFDQSLHIGRQESSSMDSNAINNGWDDNETEEDQPEVDNVDDYDDKQYMESSYDWFVEISRPRSYWESRRKEWYLEMLNAQYEKQEIRQLLERGTVSNFLASESRNKIDRLIASRIRQQKKRPEEKEEQKKDNDREESAEHWLSYSQGQTEPEASREKEEEEDGEGAIDCYDQSTTQTSLGAASQCVVSSWRCDWDNNDIGEDSYHRAASTSSPQSLPSQRFCESSHDQGSPSTNHQTSFEIELIYDLRGQMLQLFQEVSELRKSLKSCVDMNIKLQQSIQEQELRLIAKECKKPDNEMQSKGNCCICNEMQVDSLLYRCGHMCACMKCALELQWSSGKCPICGAQIADVVRAYVHD